VTDNNINVMWKASGVDENALGEYSQEKQLFLFKHACFLDYIEKIELLHPYVEGVINHDEFITEMILAGRLTVLKKLETLGWEVADHLLTAVSVGTPETVQYFLDRGADPAMENGRALQVAAVVAAQEKDSSVLKLLLNHKSYDDNTLFNVAYEATTHRWINVLEILVDKKYSVAEGDNRLLIAVSKMTTQADNVIDFLVAHGADATVRSQVCFRNALAANCIQNIKALLRAGCDPILLSRDGWQKLAESAENIRGMAIATIGTRAEEARALFDTLSLPDDLLIPVDARGITGFLLAARAGKLADVAQIVAQMPESARADLFNPAVLSDTAAYGVSIIDIAARTGQVSALFSPALWHGRVEAAQKLLRYIPLGAAADEAAEKIEALAQSDLAEKTRARQTGATDRFRLRPRGK
jgi:ankyrin repeat protein